MSITPVISDDAGVTVRVWVVPGSSRTRIDGVHGEMLKVRVSSPPEGGRANEEAARVLEAAIGSRVTLIRGMRSRAKVFQVSGSDVDTVCRKLGLV